ncbi:MAG: hypothetical protein ACYC2H_03040 [Thermoplasmatota archaeon]
MALLHPTLIAAAVAAAAAAAVYLHVGRVFALRPAAPEARVALRMFALWWLATGANIVIAAGFIAAAAFGHTDLSLQVTYGILQRILLAAALFGLMHYLLVLVRGRAPAFGLAAFYGAFALLLVGTLRANEPIGVYVGDWRTDLEFAHTGPVWVALLTLVWLIVPPVGLSIVALVAARRLPPAQRAQRNRITLVALAVVAWWLIAALAGQREAFGSEFLQVFNRLLGLSMALVVLAAYQPPRWLRRYWGTMDDSAP